MKRTLCYFTIANVLLLLLPQISSAQEEEEEEEETREVPGLTIGVHSNTASPLMLDASYFFSERIALRGSAGFFPESGSYDARITPRSGGSPDFRYKGEAYEEVEHDTQWYGGALAGLYYLPSLWRFQVYTGLETQYVWANVESSRGLDRTFDRIDTGALAGMELRVFSWLRLSGELGIGYRSGLNRNSAIILPIATGSVESSEFGLTHAGLGIQVRVY